MTSIDQGHSIVSTTTGIGIGIGGTNLCNWREDVGMEVRSSGCQLVG